MRVTFIKDWTYKYKGPLSGPWMKDFKAGQKVRLTNEQYDQGKNLGVFEEARKNGHEVHKPSASHEGAAEPDTSDAGGDS